MVMVQQTVVSAIFCLVALGLALWRPGAGRLALGTFFVVMAVAVSVVFVLVAPDGFVNLGTHAQVLFPYEWAFAEVIAKAPAVFGLLVASYQFTVGLLMIKGGQWGGLGLLGGIVFLVVISPLVPWTVPNLVMAAALVSILVRDPRLRHDPSRSPDDGREPSQGERSSCEATDGAEVKALELRGA
jgi:hypothetical protein